MSVAVSDVRKRLEGIVGLSREQAARAVDEVLDTLELEVDEFIQLRHAELRAEGQDNPSIFERIVSELHTLRFKAPRLTARQIRRRIYG